MTAADSLAEKHYGRMHRQLPARRPLSGWIETLPGTSSVIAAQLQENHFAVLGHD